MRRALAAGGALGSAPPPPSRPAPSGSPVRPPDGPSPTRSERGPRAHSLPRGEPPAESWTRWVQPPAGGQPGDPCGSPADGEDREGGPLIPAGLRSPRGQSCRLSAVKTQSQMQGWDPRALAGSDSEGGTGQEATERHVVRQAHLNWA